MWDTSSSAVFSQTAEFSQAVEKLKMRKMEHLVIDLRGNWGGYMILVVQIADELKDEELIVLSRGIAYIEAGIP